MAQRNLLAMAHTLGTVMQHTGDQCLVHVCAMYHCEAGRRVGNPQGMFIPLVLQCLFHFFSEFCKVCCFHKYSPFSAI